MTTIKHKRGLAASWTESNPVLAAGEVGIETDTGQMKAGDGVRPWKNLPYSGSGGVLTVTTMTTLTPSAFVNQFNMTAQESTLEIDNPISTDLIDGQNLLIRIKDNGTTRSINWGTSYRAIGVTLPNATVSGKVMYMGAKWNADDAKFDVISVGRQV